jgi:glyoxylase-like metal-dependent hydrolase (beta-lactamase superfamily II)
VPDTTSPMKGPLEIAPGIYGLGSELVNWYLVEGDGGLTAIDAGLQGFARSLEADLAAIGHRADEIEALVLTHSDSDHTGLAPTLRELGARVLIDARDEPTLAKPGPKGGDASPIHMLPLIVRPGLWRLLNHFRSYGALKPAKVEGAETFGDADVLDVPGSPRVVEAPGHTPGHCAILFEGRALFAGDALCTLNVISRRTGPQLMPARFNVSNDRCLESLDTLAGLDAELVLPGHGDPWRGGAVEAAAKARARGRT